MEPNLKPDQVKQLRGNFSRYIDRTQLNASFKDIVKEILEKRPEDVFQFTAEELRKKSKMEIDTNQS